VNECGATCKSGIHVHANGTCGSNITATCKFKPTGELRRSHIAFQPRCAATRFPQNFDGVSAPALPRAGQPPQAGKSAWVTSITLADTAPNAAFSPIPRHRSNALVHQ